MTLITEKKPENWKELQDLCAGILKECGWNAKTEVNVDLVRGKAELDVFAIENVNGREYKTIVECKNWKNPVPQSVVRDFRTVVADLGANSGYIVSRAGFQKGAYEAAELTNVKLLTWEEFQLEFVEQWYWEHLTKYVVEKLDGLMSYLEPLPAMSHWDMYLDDSDVERLIEMFHDHQNVGILIMTLSPYMAKLKGREGLRIDLPLSVKARECSKCELPDNINNRTGYREFLAELESYCEPILIEFRSYRDIAMSRKEAGESPRR